MPYEADTSCLHAAAGYNPDRFAQCDTASNVRLLLAMRDGGILSPCQSQPYKSVHIDKGKQQRNESF